MRFGKRGRREPDDQASNQRNLFCVRSNRNFVPGALKETTWGAGRDPDLILLKKNLSLRIPASLKTPGSRTTTRRKIANSAKKSKLFKNIMDDEAVVKTVQPSEKRRISESLELEFVYVTFQRLGGAEDKGMISRAVIKDPDWLQRLQATAPLDGYLIENDEFSCSFPRDDRIVPGLKIRIDVIHKYPASNI